MARSVNIVNTSNWDGEDWKVTIKWRNPEEHNNPGYANILILRPGENIKINPVDFVFDIEPSESKAPEPFYINGEQVYPYCVSGVGTFQIAQIGQIKP